MNNEAKNLASNLKKLMLYSNDTQATLSARAGVSQKTISNMINPGDDKATKIENVSRVAEAYKIKAWLLMYPNAPTEILISSSLERLIQNYVSGDQESRDAIIQVSEITVKYKKST